MNGTMKFLMLSCKKAAALMDKSADVKLSLKQTMQLRMHVKICDGCAAYQKQSKLIEQLLNKHIHYDLNENIIVIANNDLQNRIISKLELK